MRTSFLCFLFVVATWADNFSRINRTRLSNEYYTTVSQSVNNSETRFYSLPHRQSDVDSLNYFTLQYKQNRLLLGADAVVGGEGPGKDLQPFISLSPQIRVSSSFVRGAIDLSVFTTKHCNYNLPIENEYSRFYYSLGSEHIQGAFDFNFLLNQGWLEFYYKNLSLTVGKKHYRWGPGYKGTLGLSGNGYSPFYYYNMNFQFGNVVNVTSFLAGYEDEHYYSPELATSVSNVQVKSNGMYIDNALAARYLAGHRVDVNIKNKVQIGIYEFVNFFGSSELNRFANPLMVYYFGNDMSGTNNANLLGGLDINVLLRNSRIYGELLNDDVTMFEKTGNPDKYAFQLGYAFYPKNDKLVHIGIEYTHVSPFVYGHSRVLSRHSQWGIPMGWSYGNDQDVVTLYTLANIHKKVSILGEVNYWVLGQGTVEEDLYSAGFPQKSFEDAPFFPENPDHLFSMQLTTNFKPVQWAELDLTLKPLWYNSDFDFELYAYAKVNLPFTKTKTLEK